MQTFPPSFEFAGSLTSQARQIGNAVPVVLARLFGRHLVEHVAQAAVQPATTLGPRGFTWRRRHGAADARRGMTHFRARARAVDMLGRQQIASLPTALSELFKNSYDAYATVAIADFFRSANVLVVSDDGVGMDRSTFERHWLTIATESKLERGSTPAPAGMRPRVQLGEKGIGRLASALSAARCSSCPSGTLIPRSPRSSTGRCSSCLVSTWTRYPWASSSWTPGT